MGNLNQHVVFIATSTQEKIRDLNLIAQYKQLPITFFNLNQLPELVGVLHNTKEDGENAKDNAGKKLDGVKAKITTCRAHPKDIEAFCRHHGIENYSPERVWFGTEDSGVTLPKEIWSHLPKKIFSAMPDDVRARLEKLTKGPGVETAPFLSAALGSENIRLLIEEGLKNFAKHNNYFIDPAQLQFDEECVIKLENMALPAKNKDNSGPLVITPEGKTSNNYVYSPYVHSDEIGRQATNYDYVKPKGLSSKSKLTATELGSDYITKHSARANAIDDMVRTINTLVDSKHVLKRAVGDQRYDLVTDIVKEPAEFTVGIVNFSNPVEAADMLQEINQLGIKSWRINHMRAYLANAHEKPRADLSIMDKAIFHLSYPERLLSKSDGVVLLPDSVRMLSHPDQRLPDRLSALDEKLYILNSLVVAKQLSPRDMNKSFVIINTDHSWDDALKIHAKLANCKMTKDYLISIAPRLESLSVTSNGYFDVINGGNAHDDATSAVLKYKAAVKGAAILMKDKSLSYHRANNPSPQTSQEGTPCVDRKDLISVFCSASCENALLNELVSAISFGFAKTGKALICGGGDRYTMGSILEGVQKYRKSLNSGEDDISYIAGISTKPIAASETNNGRLHQDYNYRELTKDIYVRMAKMLIPSEKVIVAPGGAGTMQEWMGLNLLKREMPEVFGNKKLTIFDPNLIPSTSKLMDLQNHVFKSVLKTYFGNQYYAFESGKKPAGLDNISIARTVTEVLNGRVDSYTALRTDGAVFQAR